MHKSKLAGFIIDCQTDDLPTAARFWSRALGFEEHHYDDPQLQEARQAHEQIVEQWHRQRDQQGSKGCSHGHA